MLDKGIWAGCLSLQNIIMTPIVFFPPQDVCVPVILKFVGKPNDIHCSLPILLLVEVRLMLFNWFLEGPI